MFYLKFKKFCKTNSLFCGVTIFFFLLYVYVLFKQFKEGFGEDNDKMLVILKPVVNDNHIMNFKFVQLINDNDEVIPLEYYKTSSYVEGWNPENTLSDSSDSDGGYHSGYSSAHTYIDPPTFTESITRSHYVAYRFSTDETVKTFNFLNRQNCCQDRSTGMKARIFTSYTTDPRSTDFIWEETLTNVRENQAYNVTDVTAPTLAPTLPTSAPTSAPTLTPAPTPSPTPSKKDMACFPETALINNKPISELKIGDIVKTSSGMSKVTTFLHREPEIKINMIRFILENDNKTTVSKDHLIYSFAREGASPSNGKYKSAISIQIGDSIEYNRKKVKIVEKFIILCKGLYAPLTKEGNIIVDNIHYSCYTQTDWTQNVYNYHNVVNMVMYPLRNAETKSIKPIHWYAEMLMSLL